MTQREGEYCVRVLAVLERTRELVDRRAPWHRALWSVGTILELQEILDYAQHEQNDSRRSYAIHPNTLGRLLEDARGRVNEDVGIGDDSFRDSMSRFLDRSEFADEGWRRLQDLVNRAEHDYLKLWADAAFKRTVSEERIARHLAESLLDKGVSPDKLHTWLTRRLKESANDLEYNNLKLDASKTAELIEAAEGLVNENEVEYQVGIPFRKYSLGRSLLPPGASHLRKHQAYNWLETECPGWAKESSGAAPWSDFLIIRTKCWDEWSAVERAGELIARIEARISLAPKHFTFEPLPRAWVAGVARSFSLLGSRRKVCMPFLKQPGVIKDIQNEPKLSPVADALALLGSMKMSTASASLIGGWAAIEALLGEDKKYLAAHHMANILTAALPRAELTSLVHSDALPKELERQFKRKARTGSVSRDIGILEQRIHECSKYLNFGNMTDQLALTRLQELSKEPFLTLERARIRLEGTFSRLYRQRNVVMHDGRLDSITTSASFRIAPMLVAAGLDRIIVASRPTPGGGLTAPFDFAIHVRKQLVDLQNVSNPRLARLLD